MKKTILTVAFLFTFLTTEAFAMCTWGIVPQQKEYQPVDATEAFIAYENGVQTLVLQPEWQGDVTDFAIVYPTPSKPEVTQGPVDLFRQLDDATNPWVWDATKLEDFDDALMITAGLSESVTVVEEKQVGEYDVTVLTATDAEDLAEWLEDNGYNYTTADAEKVAYYVEQEGYYFIALKISAGHFQKPVFLDDIAWAEDEMVTSSIIAPDWFWGQLSPIQFTFATKKPQLPMRTLKSDMTQMTFDLYTLSNDALYVPGVDTVWSNVVDADFLGQSPALNNYNPKGKWLLRQEVTFSPQKSDEDLFLETGENNFSTASPVNQIRLNPSELNPKTGILPGTRGKVINTSDNNGGYDFVRSLTIGAQGEDVKQLQVRLNAEGFVVSDIGPGSLGFESNYFGEKTKAALIKYQNFYRAQVLEPVNLTIGTGYFGPSTIAHINGK